MAVNSEASGGLTYGEVIYTKPEIEVTVDRLACAALVLSQDDEDTLWIINQYGGGPFGYDLIRSMVRRRPDFHPFLRCIDISRYGNKHSGGDPDILQDLPLDVDVAGRPVNLIDEMTEGRDTLLYAGDTYLGRGAKNITEITFGKKQNGSTDKSRRSLNGVYLPPVFCTGYGMDDQKVPGRIGLECNRFMEQIALAIGTELTDEERHILEIERVKIGFSPTVNLADVY